MVDCGNARCAQDRRLFRKELMTWSKKIPLLVGLETIAERLAGESARDLFEPWNEFEPEKPVDWEAEESCFYCDKKLKFLFESVNELEEDDVGNTTQEGLGLGYLNELLPYCSQYYTSPTSTLDGDQPLDLSARGSRSPSRSTDGDMVAGANRSRVELKIPQIRSQKYRRDGYLNGKRAYTEEELVAAVGDIRSGKLGTRRAAALYGIPRSTLRNKIFKLGADNPDEIEDEDSVDESPLMTLTTPVPTLTDQNNSKMTLAELMQSSPFLFMPPIPFTLPLSHPLDAHNNNADHRLEAAWEWHLDHMRHKHNLNRMKEPEEYRKTFCGMEAENTSSDDKDSTGLAAASITHSPSNSKPELKQSILPELVRRLTDQRMDMERCSELPPLTTKQSSASTSPVSSNVQPTTTPLKIPSFKPSIAAPPEEATDPSKQETKIYECGRIGDTLKDIIAKTIADKVRTRTHTGTPVEPHAAMNGSVGSPVSAFSIPSASPAKRPRKQSSPQKQPSASSNPNSGKENSTSTPPQSQTQTQASGEAAPAAPVKKTRPKRGQYRKYNSQLLMEAVKAVQRGEMSVHRAGSYFGVPHSTLEYKVKERHLLRQKKIKENQPAKQGTGATSTSAGKSAASSQQQQQKKKHTEPATTSTNNKSVSKTESVNGLPKFDPTQSVANWLQHPPNGLAFNPPMGLQPSPFTANFAISTPASELLKKLQQKVQNKSPFHPEDSFITNGFPRANGNALQDGFLFIK